MKRLLVVMIAAVSCGYPTLAEIGGDGGLGDGADGGGAVAPPSGLTYSENPAMYLVGAAIAPNAPSSSGGPVAAYTVAPALPDGLDLDAGTGIISGTPLIAAAAATYTVTASNAGGSARADLVITTILVAPSGLSYATDPAMYTVGIAITPNPPSSSGGAIASYSISPALPPGLSLDVSTGVISGTPTGESAVTAYSITGTNATGSATASLTVGVDMTGFLATGGSHTCAIASGAAKCWGYNAGGQLGNDSTANSDVPVQVSGLTSGVQAIAAGGDFTCAIANGSGECWGDNQYGQLGDNAAANSSVPVHVAGLGSGVQALAAGENHVCAIVDGGAQCWGYNAFGQLGTNSTANSAVPVQVPGLTSGVQAIAAGENHTCVIVNGGVECWGENTDGQLGNNSTTQSSVPVAVPGLTSGVEAIAAGGYHTCAIVNGGVQCWGLNNHGQLGDNSTATQSSVPVAVSSLTSGVQAIAASSFATCALVNANGDAMCWGDNTYGQLGDDSATTPSLVPVQVFALSTGGKALATGAAALTTCALDGAYTECWGFNGDGEVGTGSAGSNIYVPYTVFGL